MPKKLESCVKEVKRKIRRGELPEEYIDPITGKEKKTSAWAICRASLNL